MLRFGGNAVDRSAFAVERQRGVGVRRAVAQELGRGNRRIFERALALAGLEAEDCWFIGDDVVCDIEGAAAAGIFPVWYRSPLKCTYKKPADHSPRCEHMLVESWDELGEIVRAL